MLLSHRRIYSLPLLRSLRLLLMLLCGNWPSTMSDLLTLKPPFVCTARVSGFCRGNYNHCAGRISPTPRRPMLSAAVFVLPLFTKLKLWVLHQRKLLFIHNTTHSGLLRDGYFCALAGWMLHSVKNHYPAQRPRGDLVRKCLRTKGNFTSSTPLAQWLNA